MKLLFILTFTIYLSSWFSWPLNIESKKSREEIVQDGLFCQSTVFGANASSEKDQKVELILFPERQRKVITKVKGVLDQSSMRCDLTEVWVGTYRPGLSGHDTLFLKIAGIYKNTIRDGGSTTRKTACIMFTLFLVFYTVLAMILSSSIV